MDEPWNHYAKWNIQYQYKKQENNKPLKIIIPDKFQN